MRFSNVGGSLGNGAVLLLLLWSIHCWSRFKRDRSSPSQQARPARMPRFVGKISAGALTHLVEQGPVQHCLIDLRTADEAASAPLPDTEAFRAVIATIDLSALAVQLKDAASWKAAHPSGPPFPTAGHLLTFITPRNDRMQSAAAIAAKNNFQRCLHAASVGSVETAPPAEPAFINRDACAYLLSLQQQQSAPLDFLFVDLRRHDERAMYGGIPGSVHIPVQTFVFALQQDERGFEAMCHVSKPPTDQLLILQSRCNRRAKWAALIAQELGFTRVLVCKQGSYGWRVDAGVKAYTAYTLSDPPPEPEDLPLETVDGNAAVDELKTLGILIP